MDARDYPEAYLIEDELTNYGTRNHVLDKAAKEITTLRAKVAELEAKLEKYQNLEPVAWYENGRFSINTDGGPDKWRNRKNYCGPLYALEK